MGEIVTHKLIFALKWLFFLSDLSFFGSVIENFAVG